MAKVLTKKDRRNVDAFTYDEMSKEMIEFLRTRKGVMYDPDFDSKFLSATIAGLFKQASRDAIIVFYKIEHDKNGKITDVDFDFYEKEDFSKNFELCSNTAS